MGLVIDTNIFIGAENGRLDLESLDALSNYSEAYIAAVTVSELLTGVHLAKKPDIRIQRSAFVEGVIAKIPILEFNEEVARCYSELYVHSLKAKEGINTHDLQIAATCIVHGFSLLTSGGVLDLSHKFS
ncbi:MAG: PIN domain-containing protein [Emcibacter sp.]|nr:PIN domain-containing protein [Emcibacter sp.]